MFRIKHNNLNYTETKKVKDMKEGEVAVLLNEDLYIPDEKEPVIVMRTGSSEYFEVINIAGIVTGDLFIEDFELNIGVLEDQEVVFVSGKANQSVSEPQIKSRPRIKVKPETKKEKTNLEKQLPDKAMIKGVVDFEFQKFYKMVELELPMYGEFEFTVPEIDFDSEKIKVGFYVKEETEK